ncbi:hypothetical protein D3C85_607380 [compost metagenome]
MKPTFTQALSELIEKFFGGSEQESVPVEVTKAVDDEQRMALFVVLEPDVVDLHGDTYSAEEVEKACNNFNVFCNKANIFHAVETESAKIVQSYISPADFTLDTGVEITKGTWLQWYHFPEGDETSDALWEGVKSGDISGVSIGAKALVENL